MFGLTPYERRGTLSFYDPFKELDEIERKLFSQKAPMNFRTDIRDEGDHFVLEADLPGFEKDDIAIDVKEDYLTITAERKASDEANQGSYLRRERTYGSFRRVFDISSVDESKISATFRNGVLELKLPKKEEKEPVSRKIEIG